MDTRLLASIRDQMRAKRTDQLLGIWVQNDRDIWSPEAFDAIRDILTERGAALPPQDPPIHNAPPAALATDPLWNHWLRVLLIAGLAIGVVDLLAAGNLLLAQMAERNNPVWRSGYLPIEWTRWLIAEHAISAGQPLLLLLAVYWCWKRKYAGRRAMILYAWFALGASAINIFWMVYRVALNKSSSTWEIGRLDHSAHRAVLPLLILIFMTRPQIKQILDSLPRGFDPALLDSASLHNASTETRPATPDRHAP